MIEMQKGKYIFATIFPLVLWFWCFLPCSHAQTLSIAQLSRVLPQAERFERESQPVPHWKGYGRDGKFVGVIVITTEICPEAARGYQSRISTLVGVSAEGKIVGVEILHQEERLGRREDDLEGWFVNQFLGKNIREPFTLGVDVDAISGATITSSAVINSIRESVRIISTGVLPLATPNLTRAFFVPALTESNIWPRISRQVDVLLLLFIAILAFASYRTVNRIVRYFVLGISFVYLGIYKGGGLSTINIINVFRGNFPSMLDNLYWWSLIGLALGVTLFAGRFYCGWFCPFGAFLELVDHLPGEKLAVPARIDSYLKSIKYFLLFFLLFLAVGTTKYTAAISICNVIEPFETFFQIHGNSVAWLWLLLMIILSYFIPRFFCKYFCPLGAFFAVLTIVASWLRLIRVEVKLPKGKECHGCQLAQQACGMGSLHYCQDFQEPRIDNSECTRCNECRLTCPHCEIFQMKT